MTEFESRNFRIKKSVEYVESMESVENVDGNWGKEKGVRSTKYKVPSKIGKLKEEL
ncbi:hypothetical protein [Belliella buryatensis]|uniref:hypothetical protein n=1 Tax=Belliella buryatensis TaxID=1500549 RepID=UPI0014828AD8|nr:hypothetical protein [Belliella buryatensis]